MASVAWTRAIGEPPEQETVDRAEGELAAPGCGPGAGNGVEEPGDLGGREIGVEQEACRRRHLRFAAGGLQRRTGLRRSTVLPDDRVADRPAGRAIPDEGGLALIGDSERRQSRGLAPGPAQRLARGRNGARPKRLGIVLHPARPRKNLRDFFLGDGDRRPVGVEDDGSGRGRPLIDDENARLHGRPPRIQFDAAPVGGSRVERKRPPSSDRPEERSHSIEARRFRQSACLRRRGDVQAGAPGEFAPRGLGHAPRGRGRR